ncbi:MAG: DUF1328 domain-containing protein [Halobacteriota archaeon]
MTVAIAGFPLLASGQFVTWAIGFFVLVLLAAVAGFRGVAGLSMEIAKILIVVFLVPALVAVLL